MAAYTVIAGVSSTLQRLLKDRMAENVAVTLAPPDVTVDQATGLRLNLYLYYITEDPYLKNQDIPGLGPPGASGHSPLSLVLDYLVTAYPGNESTLDADTQAQQVLGDAMTVLHDFPIITAKLHQGDDPQAPQILDSSLMHEFEKIKLSLHPLTLEDLSKIWTALPGAKFRRSVAYRVSVVQLESRLPRRLAAPVKTRRLHTTLWRRPEIQAVYRTPEPAYAVHDLRLRLGEELTIEGLNFMAAKTWVKLGQLEPIRVRPASDTRLRLTVPDAEYPSDEDHLTPRPIQESLPLQPGPQSVEVLVEQATEVVEGALEHGAVAADKRVLRSNQAVFLLLPEISAVTPPSGPASTGLTVKGKRLYREGLRSVVLLGDVEIPVPADGQTDTNVHVPLTQPVTGRPVLPPGKYTVRIMVNGALNKEEGHEFEL